MRHIRKAEQICVLRSSAYKRYDKLKKQNFCKGRIVSEGQQFSPCFNPMFQS
jgi:hypothetical protein